MREAARREEKERGITNTHAKSSSKVIHYNGHIGSPGFGIGTRF